MEEDVKDRRRYSQALVVVQVSSTRLRRVRVQETIPDNGPSTSGSWSRDAISDSCRNAIHSARRTCCSRSCCPDHAFGGHIHDLGGHDRQRAGGGAQRAIARMLVERLGMRNAPKGTCELMHTMVLRTGPVLRQSALSWSTQLNVFAANLSFFKSGTPAAATSLYRSSSSDAALSMAQRLGDISVLLRMRNAH